LRGRRGIVRSLVEAPFPDLYEFEPTTTVERALLEDVRAGGRRRTPTGVTSLR